MIEKEVIEGLRGKTIKEVYCIDFTSVRLILSDGSSVAIDAILDMSWLSGETVAAFNFEFSKAKENKMELLERLTKLIEERQAYFSVSQRATSVLGDAVTDRIACISLEIEEIKAEILK